MEKGITPKDLASRHPRLYHMAEAGSWPSIQRHGLLSTTALLDLFNVHGEARKSIEERHRPESVVIEHPSVGSAVVRDQKPMDDIGLTRALYDDLTPQEWYKILNQKVFFWLTEQRLNTLLGARAYRNSRHTVLILDTQSLLEIYADKVLLSPFNSGATKPFPHPRGKDTFLPLTEYPYKDWSKKRKKKDPIVELAVQHGVEEVERFVLSVYETGAGNPDRQLYKADGTKFVE